MRTAKTSPLIFIPFIKVVIAIYLGCTFVHASELRGRVVDETGAAISGAQVQLISRNQTYHTTVDTSGSFFVQSPAGPGTLRISAPGFSPSTVEWTESALPIMVTLKPAPVAEQIVVTAERAVTLMPKREEVISRFRRKTFTKPAPALECQSSLARCNRQQYAL
ncbi:MAG: carboxypeptidase-like regulatory domain-containing protein [Terriglobales bacterium]